MPHPPLTLHRHPLLPPGGLAPGSSPSSAAPASGVLVRGPVERLAGNAERAVDDLGRRLGGRERVPRGWWPLMDAPLVRQPSRRLASHPGPPRLRLLYEPRPPPADRCRWPRRGVPGARSGPGSAESPLGLLFEPRRPFTDCRPGPPGRAVLATARDAGFEYAFTASGFAGPPRAVVDVPGIVALTYTAGRWDGWSPFITVNDLSDLRRAERRLLRGRRPGWLIGTLDTCLWTFTGHLWDRGRELQTICRWMAGGGSSGKLVNVTPRTAARYARLLADRHLVEGLPSA